MATRTAAKQDGPDEQTRRLNDTEGVLAFHSIWKPAGAQTKPGLFFPSIGTWELTKAIDDHYRGLIDAAYRQGVEDERNRPVY